MEAVQSLVLWKAHPGRGTVVTKLHPQTDTDGTLFYTKFHTTVTDFDRSSFCRYTRTKNYEPNLTNCQSMVAWAESQNPYGAQAGYGPIWPNPP